VAKSTAGISSTPGGFLKHPIPVRVCAEQLGFFPKNNSQVSGKSLLKKSETEAFLENIADRDAREIENTNMTYSISSLYTLLNTSKDDI
jgi:hypothetical protein